MSFISNDTWNNNIDKSNIENSESFPVIYPTQATNKRAKDNLTKFEMLAEDALDLSPISSPSSSSFMASTENIINEKRSYTTPYIKPADLDLILPATPESHAVDNNEQVFLKRHSTLSSVNTVEDNNQIKTMSGSSSIVSLGRHHTTGHTLKSARQRMADKERLNLMKRSEEFQKELTARRKTFKRLSRFMDEDDDRVMMGTRISEGHQNYVLMYNMLTGIRIAVSRVTAKIDRPLTDEDYVAAHKLAFDVIGDELTPGAKYDFKFKDYAPWVFRHLREKFGVDPADYLVNNALAHLKGLY